MSTANAAALAFLAVHLLPGLVVFIAEVVR